MTEEKFKKFQDTLCLVLGTLFIMEKEDFKKVAEGKADPEDYFRKLTKKIKEDAGLTVKINIGSQIIAQATKNYFKED